MSIPRAKKSLGQNFLVDPHIQRRIVAALDTVAADTVIEIGPGQGALTQHLIGTVRELVLVELDDDLIAALAVRYGDRDDVRIVHEDVLEMDVAALVPDLARAKIVGNIPYNITTPILFHLLERPVRPALIVVMVQKEVADRICAAPGSREYGALSVGVQAVAAVARVCHVRKGAFRPVPRVDSTVLRIAPRVPAPLTAQEERDLRMLTRVAFGWRRKQLQKILRSAAVYALDADAVRDVTTVAGIAPDVRPEQVAPDALIALARALRALGRPLQPDTT